MEWNNTETHISELVSESVNLEEIKRFDKDV